MNSINPEAVSSLTLAIKSLLPAVTNPALQPIVLINPLRIEPSGIGGLIGISQDPPGEICGRRVEAAALITIKANNVDELNTTVAAVIQSLTTADRTTRTQLGILHLTLEQISYKSISESTSDSNTLLEKELIFKVLYEFVKKPQQAVGIITKVSINLENLP